VVLFYTNQIALTSSAQMEKRNSMMTTSTYKQHSTRWQPRPAMFAVVCSLGLAASETRKSGGRLGQQMSIDNRNIRH